ncbi:hypothetical protein [Sporichthya polymorpha]|uniref:hypothetical protein n=1 Tax=Sporichthya polymorpha TaxID=35751 RepID=UPI0003811A9B|nr:hypothetical protein [Sporichthya polymorpha]
MAEADDQTSTAAFLVRAARVIPAGAPVFAGFNWPILAVRVARRLGAGVSECYEAGAIVTPMPATLPSSSTDYASYAGEVSWRGSTLDLLALVPRLAAVLLDASTVDVHGRVNSFGEGSAFRSAGGGGSADVAARARNLLLLHGGGDVRRIVAAVSAVTAVPRSDARVVLLTRWGSVRVGAAPEVLDAVDGEPGRAFLEHLGALGAATMRARPVAATTDEEEQAAAAVLAEAATRGYRAGTRPETASRS